MSNPVDFLARWSRRKRQAASDAATPVAASPLPDEELSASAAATNRSALPDPPRENPDAGAPRPDSAGVDLSQLPSLESITAETDIRPFLAPGVPAELTRAALRRAWAADPAIRDHIGLSENSWDFNAQDAIPGFGPLNMSDALRGAVDRMLGRTEAPDESETAREEKAKATPAGAETEQYGQSMPNSPDGPADESQKCSATKIE